MKIFDGHLHIGGYKKPEPSTLIKKMEECGVYGGCVFSIDPIDKAFSYEERIDNLFSWVKGYEDRLFPVAWLHPYEENIFEKVRECVDRGVCAFKFIANDYYVKDEIPTKVFKLIEDLGKPIIFHSGILYDFDANCEFNKPANWECFMHYKNLKFVMAHCGHPWFDECIMLYGKFRWIGNQAKCAAHGEHTVYKNFPWVKEHIDENGKCGVPELYIDIAPGPNKVYKKEVLTKLCSCYPNGERIIFGSDTYVEDYPVDTVKEWLAFEKEILDSQNASEEFRENLYHKSLMSFLGK